MQPKSLSPLTQSADSPFALIRPIRGDSRSEAPLQMPGGIPGIQDRPYCRGEAGLKGVSTRRHSPAAVATDSAIVFEDGSIIE